MDFGNLHISCVFYCQTLSKVVPEVISNGMYPRKKDNQITPIFVTNDYSIHHLDSHLSQIENAVSLQETDIVSQEIENKKLKTRNRYNTFKDIIYNTQASSNNEVPCLVGMYGLLGAIFGVLLNIPLGFIPIHNVIENPEYFYEEMLLNFCSLPFWTAQFLICCIYFMMGNEFISNI